MSSAVASHRAPTKTIACLSAAPWTLNETTYVLWLRKIVLVRALRISFVWRMQVCLEIYCCYCYCRISTIRWPSPSISRNFQDGCEPSGSSFQLNLHVETQLVCFKCNGRYQSHLMSYMLTVVLDSPLFRTTPRVPVVQLYWTSFIGSWQYVVLFQYSIIEGLEDQMFNAVQTTPSWLIRGAKNRNHIRRLPGPSSYHWFGPANLEISHEPIRW